MPNFASKKKFRHYSRLVNDPRVPRVTANGFFRMLPNRIFGSLNTNFESKKN